MSCYPPEILEVHGRIIRAARVMNEQIWWPTEPIGSDIYDASIELRYAFEELDRLNGQPRTKEDPASSSVEEG